MSALKNLTREQLARLPREKREQLLLAIQEKRKRDLDRRPQFKPHAGQSKVIRSQALERYLFCGNGFGKTTLLVNELHWAALGHNPISNTYTPVPAKIILVIPTADKIDELLTEYRKWFLLSEDRTHKRGKSHISELTYENGSTITVITHESTDLKAEGSQWTHIFADEPPSQQQFNAIFRGGRIKGRPVRVLMAATPIKAAWLRTEVYEPWSEGRTSKYVECFEGMSKENEANLEAGWLERFSSKLNEKERGIRLEGKFFDLEGLALAHLIDKRLHLVTEETNPWLPTNPCVLVIDPHPSKAQYAIILGVDENNNRYIVDEYREKLIARDFICELVKREWFSKYRIIDIVYDSLGSADSTGGEGFRSFGDIVNEVLKDKGLGRARATTYSEKNDEDFIERIRDSLVVGPQGIPKLRFYTRCPGSYEDVRTVKWYEDKQIRENRAKLDIRQKDFLSCIKYGLATNLFYTKPERSRPHYVTKPVYGTQTKSQKKLRTSWKRYL